MKNRATCILYPAQESKYAEQYRNCGDAPIEVEENRAKWHAYRHEHDNTSEVTIIEYGVGGWGKERTLFKLASTHYSWHDLQACLSLYQRAFDEGAKAGRQKCQERMQKAMGL